MTDSELIALYRDIFAEITAKAVPVTAPTSDDPERVRHYIVPIGPLHRAAGKLGFQMFNGEAHLRTAVEEISRLKARQLSPSPRADQKLAEALQRSAEYDKPEDARRTMFSVARSLSERSSKHQP